MMTVMWQQTQYGLLLLISLHFGGSTAAKLVPAETVSTGIKETPEKLLETSSSDKQEVKLEHKVVSASAEKLGTSATIPIGFATANGILYDAPLTSGAYAGFGSHPGSFVAPQYHHQGGAIGTPGLHGGHRQLLNPGGYDYHGGGVGGFGGGHHGHVGGIGHGHGLQGHIGGYQGVVYAGHGGPHIQPHISPFGQEQVNINKQSEIAVGPYGEVHQGQSIQKTVNRVEPGLLGHAGPQPYSPYGHGGVVYMGNGLIPEHIAGVKQVGPVLPPSGYQQENVLIKKGTEVGPYGNVHSGVTVKTSIDTVGLEGGHGGYGAPGPYHQGNFHHHGLPHGGIYPHQQVSIDKVAGVGVDPYGNVKKDVTIRQQFQSGPGLGYNGVENHVIAHTDQAILGHHRHRPHQHYDGRGYLGPDPYYNNLIDPLYRTGGLGHSSTLLTTGPNRYYEGKNPIGVYERYHRLG